MRYLLLSVLLVTSCALLGCGGNSINSKIAAANKENVQKASSMYTIYSSMNGFKGPDNMEQMLEFLNSDAGAQKRISFIGLADSNLEDYLVGRDGEPLEFRWSVKTTPVAAPYPICFEQTGVDGVRWVGLSGARLLEVSDDDEYEELLKGKYRPDESERYSPGSLENATITEE